MLRGTPWERALEIADLIVTFRNMENQYFLNKARENKEITQAENGLDNAVRYVETVYAG
jgi:sterol 3beta-glucosyltransferase